MQYSFVRSGVCAPLPLIGYINLGNLQCGHRISGVVCKGLPLRYTLPLSQVAAGVVATGGRFGAAAPLADWEGSTWERATTSTCVAAEDMRRSFSERWEEWAMLDIIL